MLQALSTVSGLKNMVIQCPPSAAMRVPTDHKVLQTLISPSLQALHLDGLHLQDDHIRILSAMQQGQTSSLQSLSLSLQLTLGNIQDLGSCLADFLHNSSSSLLHLSLRLEWLVEEDVRVVTNRSFRKQRLQALQDFQNTIAHAINIIGGDSNLQRLDLIYYDSSHHRWGECPSTVSSEVFQQVLETNYTLKYLRLPFCGEMDPAIDFFLKLNRTGLRHRLLRGNPSRGECLDALVQMQGRSSSCCIPAALANTGLSMVFHLLGEMPTLFL
jgi:hypothetical protein